MKICNEDEFYNKLYNKCPEFVLQNIEFDNIIDYAINNVYYQNKKEFILFNKTFHFVKFKDYIKFIMIS